MATTTTTGNPYLDIGGAALQTVGGLFGANAYNRNMGRARDVLRNTNVESENAWLGAQENPEARDAMMRALGGLERTGMEGGQLDERDLRGLNRIKEQGAGYEAGQRAAIQSGQEQAGQGSSPNAYAAMLAGQQGGANAVSQGAGGYVSNAMNASRDRGLQALSGAAQGYGNVRSGDVGFQSSGLNAANTIGQFNAGQRLGRARSVANTYLPQGENERGALTAAGSTAQDVTRRAKDW